MITIHSFRSNGTDAVPVNVEVEISDGIGIHLIGLADNETKQSLLRTVTAMQSLGYNIPGKRVVINIAPGDLYKSGEGYDLPMALGIIGASGREQFIDVDNYVIAGELGLDGYVRDIPGWKQAAEVAKATGKVCILPTECAKSAAGVFREAVTIYGVDTLLEALDILVDGAPEWTALDDYLATR